VICSIQYSVTYYYLCRQYFVVVEAVGGFEHTSPPELGDNLTRCPFEVPFLVLHLKQPYQLIR